MKKFFKTAKIFAFGLGFLAALHSQNSHALVGFGVKGGVGMSSNSVEVNGTSAASSFGFGYLAGGSIDLSLGLIGVQADVLFGSETFEVVTTSYDRTYIHIPVQASFALIPLLSITGGAYYNVYLDEPTISVLSQNVTLSSSGLGLVAGLRINVPLAVTSLSVEARYNLGLSNEYEGAGADDSSKNQAVNVLLGVTF